VGLTDDGAPSGAPFRVVTLSYADTPLSLNSVGSRGSHWAFNAEKKRWQEIFEYLLLASRMPRGEARFIRVTARLWYPQRRTRDEGNVRYMLEKSLGDALTLSRPKPKKRGGRSYGIDLQPPPEDRWLEDDDASSFRFGTVRFDPVRAPRRTDLYLAWSPMRR
jgi:hypothetical protein